ncbi:ATP-grasp domain-containing protein [Corynebacterium sp. TA-R-1]|uniref:ATP-grasp domain-containing protein n=1 Tax=Corynebacterium stercoris TaxID=2943490 RepID=A0ABT1G0S2_9CORY|nr:ATP-grasp domain-containing protein [Corynebacterium stercoris]MCP1387624.1 ATP-grasp domain-containing protein [Corynebacterium stercoris]
MSEQHDQHTGHQAGSHRLRPHLRVLVLGSAPDCTFANELAAAYRHLGCEVSVDTLGEAPTSANPDLIAVADPRVDTQRLFELAAATNADVAPSIGACDVAFDRQSLRSTAADELGLPTLTSAPAHTPDELAAVAEEIGYPIVVKQRRGSSKQTFRSAEELKQSPFATQLPEDGLVAERYIDFDYEVTILTARSVDPATGQLATWFCEPMGTRHEAGELVECWQPAPISEAAMGNARSIAARVTGALECCGLYAIELFVDGEEVYFSQASPLAGLDGMLTRATQRLDQFELQARASLRLPIDATLVSPGAAQLVHGGAANLSAQSMVQAMAVEETGVQVIGEDILVRSTGDSVEEARARAAAAAACFADSGI